MQILMQDESIWINDGGTMRPLTVKEVLLTIHTNFEAWGTTAPFAANIQKVFGIDATTHQINAAMAQWWINFESFGSSSILLHGKQTVNQAFYHNQLVASIYN